MRTLQVRDAKASYRLSAWLDAVLESYGDRILPLDAGAARTAGATHAAGNRGLW